MMEKLGNFISEYSVRNKQDEDIPVYSVTNEHGFCTGYFSKDVSSKDRTTYKIVPYGCFAYNPSRINVGSVDWQHVEDRVIVSPLYVVFRVNEELDQRYLLHYLKSDMTLALIKAKASGSVRDNLKLSDLQEFPIVVHNIEKQRRVADNIDKVDQLISLYQQRLVVLDELVKSRFIELFGDPKYNALEWPVYLLGNLFTVGSSKRIYQSDQVQEGIPFLRISDLMNRIENKDETAELFITAELYEELRENNLVPVVGDILVTSRGTLGQCYEIREQDKFYFQDGMISWLYNRNEKITNTYLMYLFRMPGFRLQIDEVPAGSTVNYLSLVRMKNLKIMCPPLELQEQFAAFVEEVDKSKFVVQQSLRELETLKKSLMQKYFG
jgi:type I restriction enzyme, S subunit